MVELTKNATLEIQKYAQEAYPAEACGVIVSQGKKFQVVNCKNISAEPNLHFVIDPKEYSLAEELGDVVAIWHSHVNIPPEPSFADRAGCDASETLWIILSIFKSDDGFIFSEPVYVAPENKEVPYIERPYLPGVFDCYGLVRDYYKREFGISLRNYALETNEHRLWLPGHSYFVDKFEQEGFVQLFDAELKTGDCLLMQSTDAPPDHVMIYIGDQMILHHVSGRLSARNVYGGYWQKHTTHHLRHKSLC
jgi:proteasome lid subunit RPN8/RPN11